MCCQNKKSAFRGKTELLKRYYCASFSLGWMVPQICVWEMITLKWFFSNTILLLFDLKLQLIEYKLNSVPLIQPNVSNVFSNVSNVFINNMRYL